MAEATGLRNNGLPYPVYAAPYGVVFPILDADGDLVTGATGLDSEVSKNGDTFTDCTNEATEIATNSGIYYLLLTGTEMTADVVSVIIKTSSSGAKTTSLVLYPRKLVAIASGTSQGGDTGYITLAASTVLFTDQFNGCLCVATIDSNLEARIIDDCSAANQQCQVTPDWNVAPDSDDTYIIYLPEGMQFPTSNVKAVSDDATAADNLESACDNYSATRGLAGTALPAAAADAAGGLPISDAGGLDLDTLNTNVSAVLADTNEIQAELVDGGRLDLLIDAIKAKTDNLPSGVAKGVPLANFEFVMIDSTDHITPIIGLTPAGTISKDGAAFGATANAVVEVGSGVYKIDLEAAEMNADVISLIFTAVGADTRIITIVTS